MFDIDKSDEFENMHTTQVKREGVPSQTIEKSSRPTNFNGIDQKDHYSQMVDQYESKIANSIEKINKKMQR